MKGQGYMENGKKTYVAEEQEGIFIFQRKGWCP